MRKTYFKQAVIFLAVFILSGLPMLSAQDVDQGVKRLGVSYNIAEDRKIEKIGGIYEPEGLDKYMKRLIDELEEKIAHLDQQNKQIQIKLENIEKILEKIPSGSEKEKIP